MLATCGTPPDAAAGATTAGAEGGTVVDGVVTAPGVEWVGTVVEALADRCGCAAGFAVEPEERAGPTAMPPATTTAMATTEVATTTACGGRAPDVPRRGDSVGRSDTESSSLNRETSRFGPVSVSPWRSRRRCSRRDEAVCELCAAVAAARAVGTRSPSLKHLGVPVIAMGTTRDPDQVLRSQDGASLRAVYLRDGCIIGAQVASDTHAAGLYHSLMLSRRNVEGYGERLVDPSFSMAELVWQPARQEPAIHRAVA